MRLTFSDRQVEVRLGDCELHADQLFVQESGKTVVGQNADLLAAISVATSLSRDVVEIELGRAFPGAAQQFGGTSGTLYLRPARSPARP
jgi:hypothetical protein